jgi:hypothetical protein
MISTKSAEYSIIDMAKKIVMMITRFRVKNLEKKLPIFFFGFSEESNEVNSRFSSVIIARF